MNPFDAGPKQLLRAEGVILDEHGSVRTVDGTLIQTTAPAVEAGNRVLLPISWQPVGGALQRLVLVLSGAVSRLYRRDTTPWTLLGTFVNGEMLPQAAILANLLCITDGYSPPKTWDGAAFASLAALPGAKHIINHQGFLWAGNTKATTTATDGPSVLRQSDLNAPATWNVANVQFIGKDDGTQIQGLALFTIAESGIAPTDTLIVFKDQSGYHITGNMGTGGGAPSSNFSIQQIKSTMGCYAPRSIQFLPGFGVVRLTHQGFALFNGVDDRLVSEEERPRLFGRDDLNAIDWTNVRLSWAVQSQNPPLYACFCPAIGTGLTIVFLYDLVRKAWTVIPNLPFSVASAALIAEANSLPVVLLTDATGGAIRRWFAQDPTWDGVPVSWRVRLRPAFDGSQMRRMYFRRLQLDLLAPLKTTVTESFIAGNVQKTNAAVQVFTPAASGGATWGVAAWGQFTWGAGPGSSLFGFQPSIDMDFKAPNAIVDISGTGPIRLRGAEWHLRPMPLTGARL